MKLNVTKAICVNAVVAALYIVFTMPFGTISTSSGLQFRPAEALTILPALFPYVTVGLTIGCAVSNIVSAFGVLDVILGSLTTLIAGILTSLKPFRKFYLAPIPPVVLNALILPAVWILAGGEAGWTVYGINCASLLLTQGVVIFGLGIPLYFFADKKLKPLLSLDTEYKERKNNENK
ncbi:MAG: QueT transporter family protein [Corallococcus sp.]|nr:QueT transporter family protein [Corallococcus sp.]